MMMTKSFHYDLPENLIAQHPADRRDASRLMLLDGDSGVTAHHVFSDLPDLLSSGDCLVLNNTRVIPARLIGIRSDTGTAVEVLLLRRVAGDVWDAIVRPGRRIRTGHKLEFIHNRLNAEVLSVQGNGNRLIRFDYTGTFETVLSEAGTLPLPPYIHEQLSDPQRYQTVYACADGSAAAPTAGLHFTPELLDRLKEKNIAIVELTLHVGIGTFRPVKTELIQEHQMHAEYFTLPQSTVDIIERTKANGGQIISVGTTTTRVLESVAAKYGQLRAVNGSTDIFIYPGFRFQVIDRLITNFHLPESTLIMLACAFTGQTSVMAAYREAVLSEYRFFSFGDAMLLNRRTHLANQTEWVQPDFHLNVLEDKPCP
jgi:S-adenosylmethionine:tRNA ribosyltransferase-isomerase